MDRTPDLLDRLLDPAQVEGALFVIENEDGVLDWTAPKDVASAIRELHRRLEAATLPICDDCGARPTEHQVEYNLDCKCGGAWMAPEAAIARWNKAAERWEGERKKLKEQLGAAKVEGAAEELERIYAGKGSSTEFDTEYLLRRAAALRKQVKG